MPLNCAIKLRTKGLCQLTEDCAKAVRTEGLKTDCANLTVHGLRAQGGLLSEKFTELLRGC